MLVCDDDDDSKLFPSSFECNSSMTHFSLTRAHYDDEEMKAGLVPTLARAILLHSRAEQQQCRVIPRHRRVRRPEVKFKLQKLPKIRAFWTVSIKSWSLQPCVYMRHKFSRSSCIVSATPDCWKAPPCAEGNVLA